MAAAKTIKIFLSELDMNSQFSGSFWAMAIPTIKEIPEITPINVEKEVRDVFEVECGDREKIPNGVFISVFDKNDNKIFGGNITQDGSITLIPIVEIFQ